MIERNWQELIRPEKPLIETGLDGQRKARMIAEPLERGFGVTLGNALRRVLLSSLQGAAVTSVQIDGVVHEFSSMEGVREDVVDIVLNIKSLALRMHAEGPKRMTLRATGPGPVTAGQIDAIYFEEVRRHAGVDAGHIYGGFLATLTGWCEHRVIPYQGVPVGTIKKFVTGKGNADKQVVIDAVRGFGFSPADDNEADATALLLWAMETKGSAQ